ncbi:hypothetical protein HHI36_013235 [Cryptolaemus montrouzieri]|uniref:Uncharacterized protein n=1 Tax=Cryptolaemus montrouzieri TaxID=559131 RepID=A0ABD2NH76_9CUCU
MKPEAPKKAIQGKRKPVYWWNEDIRKGKKVSLTRKRHVSRINRTNIPQDIKEAARTENKKERKKFKDLCLKSKKEKWNELIADLEEDIWGGAYKESVRDFPNNKSATTLKRN